MKELNADFDLSLQLGSAQAFRPEGRYQKDYPVRSLYVLPPNPARDEVAPILQPREYHFNP